MCNIYIKQQSVNDRVGSVTSSFTPIGDLQTDKEKEPKHTHLNKRWVRTT